MGSGTYPFLNGMFLISEVVVAVIQTKLHRVVIIGPLIAHTVSNVQNTQLINSKWRLVVKTYHN